MKSIGVVIAVMLSGCALLGGGSSVDVRYFSPEKPTPPPSPPPSPSPVQLRLGRVAPASYLRDRIAYRDTQAEVGFYTRFRWAEPPEAYVRRGLARELFEQRQLREIVSGTGPSLEVDLLAFEEIRAPRHVARITVSWRLRDGRTVIVQRTATIERPIAKAAPADQPAAIVDAMAAALRAITGTVVEDVVAELTLAREAVPPAVAAPTP